MVATLDITLTFNAPGTGIYYRGLSDFECNDPLNDGLYQPNGYKARNAPPFDGKVAIPEVRKMENGDACYLVEPVERLWYHAWERRFPSLPLEEKHRIWRSYMRDNAAFTNKAGSDTKHSWVLGTNPTKEPMRSEGVVTPGGNLFRACSTDIVNKYGTPCIAVWCLDWQYLSKLGIGDALLLAERLPPWLWHVAKIVHSDGSVTEFDHQFGYPMMTSKETERTEIVDGFNCRRNYLRASRLQRV